MDVRPVDGRVTARRPTSPLPHPCRVVLLADVQLAAPHALVLGMTAQAEIRVRRDEQLVIDRAVRCVTNGTAFPQRFVFKDKWPRLFAMALRAIVV